MKRSGYVEFSDEKRDENMMLPPEVFIGSFADSSYEELIAERDELIEAIRKYEENEKNGDRSGSEWNINPSPDVVYLMQNTEIRCYENR